MSGAPWGADFFLTVGLGPPSYIIIMTCRINSFVCKLHLLGALCTSCSGITAASHAEGPGFKSQCVHFSKLLKAVPLRCHPCEAHAPKLGNITRSPLRTSLRHERNRRIGILKARQMGTWRNDAKPLNMRPALGSSSNHNDTEGTRTLADRTCL